MTQTIPRIHLLTNDQTFGSRRCNYSHLSSSIKTFNSFISDSSELCYHTDKKNDPFILFYLFIFVGICTVDGTAFSGCARKSLIRNLDFYIFSCSFPLQDLFTLSGDVRFCPLFYLHFSFIYLSRSLCAFHDPQSLQAANVGVKLLGM